MVNAQRKWWYDGTTFRRRSQSPAPTRPNPAPPVTPVAFSSFFQTGDTFYQTLARVPAGTIVDFAGAVKMVDGFSMGRGGNPVNSGYAVFDADMVGWYNGELQMTPGSSIDAAYINSLTAANGDTNNFSYLRLGKSTAHSGSDASSLTNPTYNGYFMGTLRSTEQGSDYNGLQMYGCVDSIVELSYFYGFQGSAGFPPGENFIINNLWCLRPVTRWVTVDMLGIGAAGMGSNNCKAPYTSDSTFKNSGHGAGVTHYQTSDPTYERVTATGNWLYGINYEKVSGLITMRDCTFLNNRVSHICVDTDGPSAVVNIYDPVYDGMNAGGKLHIKRHDNYAYPPTSNPPANGQKISDFHIFRNGVETTADELAIDR